MHADKCIAKVTNFVTTIMCYRDGTGFYAVEVRTLNKTEKKPVKAKMSHLTEAEAIAAFDYNARKYGFERRLTIEDFMEKKK